MGFFVSWFGGFTMTLYRFVRQGLEKGRGLNEVLSSAARESRRLGLWSRSRSLEEVRLAHIGEKGIVITLQREDHGRPYDCVYFIPVEGRPLYVTLDRGEEEGPYQLQGFFGIRDEHGGGWCDEAFVTHGIENACVELIENNR
jgi:hypothetical protein